MFILTVFRLWKHSKDTRFATSSRSNNRRAEVLENINDVIYSIPKKKIINLNKSFELFFLSLRNKPKKIISFPSTAIYFVRQFSGNQKIEMLSFSKIFKKNYFDLFNKEYLKQNKIYLFLKKII
jgi:hypothetical protein